MEDTEHESSSSRTKYQVRGKEIRVSYPGLQILDHGEAVYFSVLIKRFPETKQFRVDLSGVLSLPGGFFGALLDTVESGRRVLLLNATPEVKALIGYRRFVTRGVVHL